MQRLCQGKRTLIISVVGLGFLTFLSCAALAQRGMLDKKDVIAERRELMKNNGANFKDLRLKAKAGQFARMAVNAQNIAINARHIPLLFPEGSLGTAAQKSRAKPEIWQDWDGFVSAAKKARDAAMALWELTKDAGKKPVSAAQVNAAVKNLVESCKACHKKYRKPKKK